MRALNEREAGVLGVLVGVLAAAEEESPCDEKFGLF